MGANSDYCPIDTSMSITVGGESRLLAQQADMKFVTMSETLWRKSVRSHCGAHVVATGMSSEKPDLAIRRKKETGDK
jgi:hypothetical protein